MARLGPTKRIQPKYIQDCLDWMKLWKDIQWHTNEVLITDDTPLIEDYMRLNPDKLEDAEVPAEVVEIHDPADDVC